MTQSKRVALTLKPEIYDTLDQLSKLTATPKTAIINDLLMQSLPVFMEVVKAIQQTKQGQNQVAIETMGKFLGDASQLLNQAHIDFGGVKQKHGKQ